MDYREINLNTGKNISKGRYIAWKDTSALVFVQTNPSNPLEYYSDTMKYYIPKKTGKWIFYDDKGNVVKREKFKN